MHHKRWIVAYYNFCYFCSYLNLLFWNFLKDGLEKPQKCKTIDKLNIFAKNDVSAKFFRFSNKNNCTLKSSGLLGQKVSCFTIVTGYILLIVDRKVLDRISVFTAPIRSFTITANVYECFFYTSMVFTTCQMNLLLYGMYYVENVDSMQ